MADITEAIRRLIFEYVSEGADKVVQTQEAVAASATKTDKASLSLEKSFGNLERRYVETVRHQQDYAKVQATVNAAVAQNPALQERANAVLAAAGEHFDKAAAGANKGGIAVSFFSKALSTILGPAGLIGIALTALTAAVAYLVDKFQLIPQVLQGVSAALAAVGWGKVAQDVANYAQRMREVHAATEAQKAAIAQIQAIHPTISKDVAGQLQLLEAQLVVAKALTEQDKIIAQEKLKIVQGLQQGLTLQEATLLAAKERVIAETNIETATLKSNDALSNTLGIAKQLTLEYNAMGQQIDGLAGGYDAMGRQIAEQADTQEKAADAKEESDDSEYARQKRSTAASIAAFDAATKGAGQVGKAWENVDGWLGNIDGGIRNATTSTYQMVDAVDEVFAAWGNVADGVERTLDLLKTQFADQGEGYTSTYDPLMTSLQKETLEKLYGAENVEAVTQLGSGGGAYTTYRVMWENLGDSLDDLTSSTDSLNSSTDSLNATMQDALSPFYSQDPRTTKLGFRAGVTGNPDWMTGATNTNPLVAVLGAGATAPGMADGGSFTVGGGYSANDNRMAVFPVASGEEIVVNRNKGGRGGQVVNIDNRIIVAGSLDADTMGNLKVSRYQQAQRMRSQLARA